MGTKLVEFYAEIESSGGLMGKMKLAQLTRIPSTRAMTEPDNEKNVQAFMKAMETLRLEYSGARSAAKSSGAAAPKSLAPGGEEMLWGVLSSLHDAAVVVFDESGKHALAWGSRSLAQKYDKGVSGSAANSIAKLLEKEHGAEIRKVFSDSKEQIFQKQINLGGNDAWFSIALSPVDNTAGKVSHIAAFVQDISERKRSEAMLSQSEARLREHNRVYLDLVASKASFLGDLSKTIARITEAAATTIGCARASIWFYDEAKTKIVCVDLFEKDKRAHSAGIELMAHQFPGYFKSLLDERTIAANNAHTDPRTSEFSAVYLTPLGINSMLDVPIWVGGQMIGVVCHEHIGPQREWTPDEENFAYLMANFVALAKERNG